MKVLCLFHVGVTARFRDCPHVLQERLWKNNRKVQILTWNSRFVALASAPVGPVSPGRRPPCALSFARAGTSHRQDPRPGAARMRRRLTSTVLHWRRTTALCAVPCAGAARTRGSKTRLWSGNHLRVSFGCAFPSFRSSSPLSPPSLQMVIAPTDETSRPERGARTPPPPPATTTSSSSPSTACRP